MSVSREMKKEIIPTRWSLLDRLKDWEDQEGWKEFFDTYWKLIYCVALKAGLSPAEAEDVVQETLITVAKSLKTFQLDPQRGSFKGWLLNTTRWRIADQLRKRAPAQGNRPRRKSNATARTGTMERIADPNGVELEGIWDEEWEKNLMDGALAALKAKVNSKHFQIFYLNVVREMPAREVAQSLKVNLGLVYVVKLNLSRRLNREYRRLLNATR